MTRSLAFDKETIIRSFELVQVHASDWGHTIVNLQLQQDWPPSHLRTVRVYEFGLRLPGATPSDAELDILCDVILDKKYDVARNIVGGFGGPWTPTSARIVLIDLGANRILLDGVCATSAWWLNLDCNAPPNSAYQLRVVNETDLNVTYRGDLIFGPGVF